MIRVAVPRVVVDYAREDAKRSVPENRSAGFAELPGQQRGDGDVLDAIATDVLYAELCARNVPCSKETRSGGGDNHDLEVRGTTWNVKSSSYAPIRNGLHLYVKEEELLKPLTGYIQVFVHLDETDDPEPHVHIAGVAITDRVRAQKRVTIPRTAHQGVGLPCSALTPWERFIERAAGATRMPLSKDHLVRFTGAINDSDQALIERIGDEVFKAPV